MKTIDKTPAARAGSFRIPLTTIVSRADLRVRSGNLSEHHVDELRQAIKRGDKMPPVLVWQEIDDHGTSTGRFVLLDGKHRLAALRAQKQQLSEVAVQVFRGTLQEAHLAMVHCNIKVNLPLTPVERVNAAWANVRMDNKQLPLSRAKIARACGVGESTVSRMRRVWKCWRADGPEPSGSWHRDRLPTQDEEPPASGLFREQEVQRLTKDVRSVVGKLPEQDVELFAEVIMKIMGWRLPNLLDFIVGEPEEGERPWSGLSGDDNPNAPPEIDPDAEF